MVEARGGEEAEVEVVGKMLINLKPMRDKSQLKIPNQAPLQSKRSKAPSNRLEMLWLLMRKIVANNYQQNRSQTREAEAEEGEEAEAGEEAEVEVKLLPIVNLLMRLPTMSQRIPLSLC